MCVKIQWFTASKWYTYQLIMNKSPIPYPCFFGTYGVCGQWYLEPSDNVNKLWFLVCTACRCIIWSCVSGLCNRSRCQCHHLLSNEEHWEPSAAEAWCKSRLLEWCPRVRPTRSPSGKHVLCLARRKPLKCESSDLLEHLVEHKGHRWCSVDHVWSWWQDALSPSTP